MAGKNGASAAKWAEVYQHLRARILSCELAPGTRVSELLLAKEYGCSPTPVRDALNALRQEGLIVRESPRSQIVKSLDLADIRSLSIARAALECACARIYLTIPSEILALKLDELEQMTDDMRGVGEDQETLLHINRDFHVALAELTGNEHLIRMVSTILESSERIFSIGLITMTAEDIWSDHLNILAACREKDEALLLQLLTRESTETVRRVSDNLLKQFSV